MTFLFEVSTPHVAYACLGGFVVIFGMFSLFIRERLYIGEAIWAFLFGVIVGPYGANILNPRAWGGGESDMTNEITLEFTRVVLAIGVFAVGVELPKQYMKKHWKSLAFLLGPVMTWGWFVAGAVIYALIPGLNFLSALVVAACLTPTDPILAAAVIGGKYADKHVPAHLRHLLAAESGCNDGAAFPFLFIALYLTIDATEEIAVKDWFLLLWLYQIVLGTVIGSLIGIGFRHLMKFCERKELIDRQSYVAQYVSLALLTIGVCTLLGSDDLLAAFACGVAFAWDGFFNRQTEESVFSSVIDLLFNVSAFVFVGAWMPFNLFSSEELTLSVWRLIVIGILVLLLRRLPIMIALYKFIPDVKTFREAVFSGHFGPMGIGAIFISTLAVERLPHPHEPPQNQAELLAATIQPIVAFMVLCSILVHGLSIPFFSLGRRVHSVRREWSRRSTLDASGAPEWANQTRKLKPGEKPEVNRDVERDGVGENRISAISEGSSDLLGAEKADLKRENDEELTGPEKIKVRARDAAPVEDAGGSDKTLGGDQSGGNSPTTEAPGAESPPDGDDVLSEWKEGNDRIIERRAGPGEEVEVEVQRNAFADDAPNMTSVFRGQGAMVHNTTREYVAAIRRKAEAAAGMAPPAAGPSRPGNSRRESPEHGTGSAPDSAATSAMPSRVQSEDEGPSLGPQGQVAEDSDMGWASDEGEGPEPRTPTSPLSPTDSIASRKSIPSRRGKRRYSMRRSIATARAAARAEMDAGPPLEDEEDERGRQAARRVISAASSAAPSRHTSQSPARSIRWADDEDEGSAESPRKVVFELPPPISAKSSRGQ